MNIAARTGLMHDIVCAHLIAKMITPDLTDWSNAEVRELGRELGLRAPRTHTNRNRDRQNRRRKAEGR